MFELHCRIYHMMRSVFWQWKNNNIFGRRKKQNKFRNVIPKQGLKGVWKFQKVHLFFTAVHFIWPSVIFGHVFHGSSVPRLLSSTLGHGDVSTPPLPENIWTSYMLSGRGEVTILWYHHNCIPTFCVSVALKYSVPKFAELGLFINISQLCVLQLSSIFFSFRQLKTMHFTTLTRVSCEMHSFDLS